jgi:hypothetical protein
MRWSTFSIADFKTSKGTKMHWRFLETLKLALNISKAKVMTLKLMYFLTRLIQITANYSSSW